ncbi:hypothetical protein GCK72_023312 [Caenorhabditis remanei]|uniref:Uncharacterized protein n=1 Tax=Caenorhabditis remanei TaxID=31234 RepID=A0A2P4WHQ8_CAERE|nr:hypothetical protein GCK72_023312 [Caenorhabditis remanei]KAF1746854.1 hypothetical protein GCK72_023312 [Caenorhabditis remanei]
MQTEQWKNIQEFHVKGLIVNGSLCDFAHISRLELKVITVTTGDLIFLKEAFMTMATTKNHVSLCEVRRQRTTG